MGHSTKISEAEEELNYSKEFSLTSCSL